MGTNEDSKIRTCRKARDCETCAEPIGLGDEYLDYRLGLYWHERVCLNCGLQWVDDEDGRRHLRFPCKAVERRAGKPEPWPWPKSRHFATDDDREDFDCRR